MSEENNIDKLFREHARAFTPEIPEGSWERIAGSLYARKRRRVFWLWAACVAGFMLIPAAIYFFIPPDVTQNQVVTHAQPVRKAAEPVLFADTSTASEYIVPIDTAGNFSVRLSEREVLYTHNEGNLTKAYVNLSLNLHSGEIFRIGDTAITTASKEPLSSESLTLLSDSADLHDPRPLATSLLVSLDTFVPSEGKRASRYFWLGLLGGQASSYRSGDELRNSVAQVASASDEHLSSSALSLEFGLALSPRISVHSGFHKGSFGNISEFVINESDLQFVNIDRFGESSSGVFTASNINNLMNSSGIQGLDEIVVFEKMKVEYTYMDIPLGARFTLVHGSRWDILAGGGMNLTLLGGNNVSLLKGNEWYEIGRVVNLRKSLFGIHTNLGMEYSIAPALQLGLQAGFRRYLSSVSYNKAYDYKPYSYDFLIGLRYKMRR
jgi:hypothetical protein